MAQSGRNSFVIDRNTSQFEPQHSGATCPYSADVVVLVEDRSNFGKRRFVEQGVHHAKLLGPDLEQQPTARPDPMGRATNDPGHRFETSRSTVERTAGLECNDVAREMMEMLCRHIGHNSNHDVDATSKSFGNRAVEIAGRDSDAVELRASDCKWVYLGCDDLCVRMSVLQYHRDRS
jgi:hypothetical protein